MTRSILSALLLVLALPVFAQNASDSSTMGTISGTVIDSKTSAPISGASVQLLSRGATGSKSATTNADGAFIFRGLAPGRYGLNASHEGYSSGPRARVFSGSSSNVTVGSGQTIGDVVIRLSPTGVIAGRITNEREQPMPQIFVAIVKRSYHDGELSLSNVRSAFTDEHGEFHIAGVPPGQYCVKATTPRTWPEGSAPSHVYIPVFYPDAIDPTLAQTVSLHPGEELSGINFTLTAVHAVHVKGKVVSAKRASMTGANVTLSQFGSNGYSIDVQTDKDGKFDFAGVPAGSYTLDAQWSADMESGHLLTGRNTISVGDTDLRVPDVIVYPGATVSGRIVVEGDRKISMPRSASLIPVAGSPGAFSDASVAQDGSFAFEDVPQGDYRIRITPVPSGYYIKSESDETAASVVVNHGQPTATEVLLDYGAGQIQGTIYQDTDKQIPAPAARVILLPDSGRQSGSEGYRVATSDRSGRFILQSVPPGDYSVLALEDAERDAFADPDLMRAYKEAAHAVKVETGATVELQLPLTVPVSN